MRYDTYSLKKLLGGLADKFPGITEAYLFGSRLHRTRSTRSDVDLLITVDESVIAEDVRDFALAECPALDFFLIDEGVAVSCANGSKVKARSKRALISSLAAVKIWTKARGFLSVDIDWDFHVIKGMNPTMTTLVTATPFPSKAEAVFGQEPAESLVREASRWSNLKVHPLWIIVTVACLAVAATFKVIHEVRIIPLKEEVVRLEKQIGDKQLPSKPKLIELENKPNKSIQPTADALAD